MSTNYEITPYKGVGKIVFSLTPNAVRMELGEPDFVEEDQDEITFLYSKLGMSIIFSQEKSEYEMSSIEIDKGDYKLWDKTVIGVPYDEVMNLIKLNSSGRLRCEENENTSYIFCDAIGLDFEFENNKATVIYINKRTQQ